VTRKVVANLQKAAEQLHSPVVFRYQVPRCGTAVGHSVVQTTVPGQLQQFVTEIVQRALSELPSPIDLHVFSDYQFDLFSTLK